MHGKAFHRNRTRKSLVRVRLAPSSKGLQSRAFCFPHRLETTATCPVVKFWSSSASSHLGAHNSLTGVAEGSGATETDFVNPPEVRYAKSGQVNIAYAVAGEGPFDLVFVSGWVLSALDYAWEGPAGDLFRRLASFSRLILFDKRGTGLSDRVAGIADLETRMDDVRAVMDAARSERAAVMGVSEGGPMTLLFAATYPERTAAAIVFGTGASFVRHDDYPWRPTREDRVRGVKAEELRFGSSEYLDEHLGYFAPSLSHDDEARAWWARFVRASASPGAAGQLYLMNTDIDVRNVLPTIGVPTLVLHSRDDEVFDVEEGRYIAARVPGAELVELPGREHGWFVGTEPIAREVERFLQGIWDGGEWDIVDSDRVLATVLFTDIVGSTAKAAELGDRSWRELVEHHHAIIRRQLVRYGGRELDTAGDGFFASFDGPARAIRCACAIAQAVRKLGIDVRAGLHTGECEVIDAKVGGIAVHIGARVAAEAQPGEVLVSSTVKDLVAGSGIEFHDRGTASLKGVPGEWRIYAVASTG
jgi:pimeloyl-ACP methyl ester carboxylesterase/class 3 adenylate cyclase